MTMTLCIITGVGEGRTCLEHFEHEFVGAVWGGALSPSCASGWGGYLRRVFESTFLGFCQGRAYRHRDDDIVGVFLLERCDTRGRVKVGRDLPETLHGRAQGSDGNGTTLELDYNRLELLSAPQALCLKNQKIKTNTFSQLTQYRHNLRSTCTIRHMGNRSVPTDSSKHGPWSCTHTVKAHPVSVLPSGSPGIRAQSLS